MNKFFTLSLLCAITISVKAQDPLPTAEPFGKVNMADLTMTACDFEKDANAEVLIDKGDLYYDQSLNIVVDYYKRIKIFNDNGKNEANIKLSYEAANNYEYITGLQAETINLVDGKVEITKLDKKQIFKQIVNKYETDLVFSMPNIKAGSIIEFKYSWNTTSLANVPAWYFQEKIPVRYSELNTSIPEYFYFSTQIRNYIPLTKQTSSQGAGRFLINGEMINFSTQNEQRLMTNIKSLRDEPFMSSFSDNLQQIHFHLTTFKPPYGFVQSFSDTWVKVADILIQSDDFGVQAKRRLTDEDAIIDKAKALKSDDAKIAYLFNEVKNDMKWNGENGWYSLDGTAKAWDAKTGNSTEINLILYHLLNKSGVQKAMPMVVSTREHGKVNPSYTFLQQFNRAVVYIPVDSTRSYVLDASGKYNLSTEIPDNLLNSSGFYFNMNDKNDNGTVFLQKTAPAMQSVFITAEIKPDGKLNGTAQISSLSYNRVNCINRYKTDGETKYIENLRDDDNNLKISSLKMENMETDTLPLTQSFNFNLDLAGADDSYIYVNPNLFTSMHKNTFLGDNRFTDIDFGYLRNLSVNGMYKIPAGYNVDALPKSVSMSMPDGSIVFKRLTGQQDGTVVVRYTISYKKSIFFKEDYPDFHEFFKKMYEMMNEQIVLKKS